MAGRRPRTRADYDPHVGTRRKIRAPFGLKSARSHILPLKIAGIHFASLDLPLLRKPYLYFR
jgi:hypothetical protein